MTALARLKNAKMTEEERKAHSQKMHEARWSENRKRKKKREGR